MIEQRYFEATVVGQGVREGQVGREPEEPLPVRVGVGLGGQWPEHVAALGGHLEDLDPVRVVTGEVKATVP
jgi:hypothetical protein